jgi:hypothetical protein
MYKHILMFGLLSLTSASAFAEPTDLPATEPYASFDDLRIIVDEPTVQGFLSQNKIHLFHSIEAGPFPGCWNPPISYTLNVRGEEGAACHFTVTVGAADGQCKFRNNQGARVARLTSALECK